MPRSRLLFIPHLDLPSMHETPNTRGPTTHQPSPSPLGKHVGTCEWYQQPHPHRRVEQQQHTLPTGQVLHRCSRQGPSPPHEARTRPQPPNTVGKQQGRPSEAQYYLHTQPSPTTSRHSPNRPLYLKHARSFFRTPRSSLLFLQETRDQSTWKR